MGLASGSSSGLVPGPPISYCSGGIRGDVVVVGGESRDSVVIVVVWITFVGGCAVVSHVGRVETASARVVSWLSGWSEVRSWVLL